MPSVNKLRLRDFDHGLAQTLGVVALFVVDKTQGKVIDLVTGTAVTIGSGVTIVDTPEGPALHFSGSQYFNFDHPEISGAVAITYVVAARIRPTAQQGGNPGNIFGVAAKTGTQTTFGVGWDNSATPNVGGTYLTGNGAGMTASVTTALNRFDTVFSTGDGGGNTCFSWVNGLPLTAAAITGGIANPNTITFGAQYRAAGALRWATGDLLWAAIISVPSSSATFVALYDTQAWKLYANNFPHCLFRSTRRHWLSAAPTDTPPNSNLLLMFG